MFKKVILCLLICLMFSVSALAAVPNGDGYFVLEDFEKAIDADLNGGSITSVFVDLSDYGLKSGTQAIKDGTLCITPETPSTCMFDIPVLYSDIAKENWLKADGLRYWIFNDTDSEICISFELYLETAAEGYNYPWLNGTAVYMVSDEGEKLEPDFLMENHYCVIPQGFKGWVIIPSTFAADGENTDAGWCPSSYGVEGIKDYTVANWSLLRAIRADIRMTDATMDSIYLDNFQLYGKDFDKPDPDEIISGNTEKPSQEPAASASVSTAPSVTAAPSALVSVSQTEEIKEKAYGLYIEIGAGVAAVAVITAVILILGKRKKKEE